MLFLWHLGNFRGQGVVSFSTTNENKQFLSENTDGKLDPGTGPWSHSRIWIKTTVFEFN